MLFHYQYTKDTVPMTILAIAENTLSDTPFTWEYTPTLEQADIDTKSTLLGYVGRFYLTMTSEDFVYPEFLDFKEGLAFVRSNTEYDYTLTDAGTDGLEFALRSSESIAVAYPVSTNITMAYAYTEYAVTYPAIP
jgi:hypothetical protein